MVQRYNSRHWTSIQYYLLYNRFSKFANFIYTVLYSELIFKYLFKWGDHKLIEKLKVPENFISAPFESKLPVRCSVSSSLVCICYRDFPDITTEQSASGGDECVTVGPQFLCRPPRSRLTSYLPSGTSLCYSLVLSFANRLSNVLDRKIANSESRWIWLSYLLSFSQSEIVSQTFLDFHDLDIFKDCKPFIL